MGSRRTAGTEETRQRRVTPAPQPLMPRLVTCRGEERGYGATGGPLFPGGAVLRADRGRAGGGSAGPAPAPLPPRSAPSLPSPSHSLPSPPLPTPFPLPFPPSPSAAGGSHARRRRGGGGRVAVAAMVGPGALQRARRLCHWGPAVALAVVAVCSATAMADAALWYWPLDTAGGSVNFVMLLNWTVMILYNYFSAMFVGPGYVPLGWTPVSAALRPPRPGAWRGPGGQLWGRAGRPRGQDSTNRVSFDGCVNPLSPKSAARCQATPSSLSCSEIFPLPLPGLLLPLPEFPVQPSLLPIPKSDRQKLCNTVLLLESSALDPSNILPLMECAGHWVNSFYQPP